MHPPRRRHRRSLAEILHPDHCWFGCTDGRAQEARHFTLSMHACGALRGPCSTRQERILSKQILPASQLQCSHRKRRRNHRRPGTPSEAVEAAVLWFPCCRPARPPLCRCSGYLHTRGKWRHEVGLCLHIWHETGRCLHIRHASSRDPQNAAQAVQRAPPPMHTCTLAAAK